MTSFPVYAYLFLYLLGYRVNKGAWHSYFDFDRTKGSGLVSFVMLIVILLITIKMGDAFGFRIFKSKISLYILAFSILSVNYYILISKGYGTRFEERFDGMDKKTRMKIISTSAALYAALLLGLAAMVML